MSNMCESIMFPRGKCAHVVSGVRLVPSSELRVKAEPSLKAEWTEEKRIKRLRREASSLKMSLVVLGAGGKSALTYNLYKVTSSWNMIRPSTD